MKLYGQYTATGIDSSLIGLKYFNVFGPNENHQGDIRSLVNKSFDRIRATGNVHLFKSTHPDFRDGEQMRDFLHIKDAVDMTLHLALEHTPTGLSKLGFGVASTSSDLVTTTFRVMGRESSIECIEMPETLREQYQNPPCADISKLHSTDYTRTITPLARVLRNYVTNSIACQPMPCWTRRAHLTPEPMQMFLTPYRLLSLSLTITAIAMMSPPVTTAQESPSTDGSVEVGAFQFHLAAPWSKENTTRPMVKAIATWQDPQESGHAPIQAAFYHFGEGQGGSIEANIERWQGQFQTPPEVQVDALEIDGHKVTFVILIGTYLDGPMFGQKTPRENHALLGAILESKGGAVFIKATAPRDAAEACREHFRALAMSPFQS